MTLGEGARPPAIRFHLPAPALRDYVTSYYIVDAPAALEDRSHPEWANVRFMLSGEWLVEDRDGQMVVPPSAAIFGPTDRSNRFASPAGGAFLGVGLTPLGWFALIGGDAGKVANRAVPLGAKFGRPGEAIGADLAAADDAERVVLLDALLQPRLRKPTKRHALVRRVHDVLVSGPVDDVGDFAARVGVERRTLIRLCTAVFGFPPVRLLARQRFLRTLSHVHHALDRPLGELIDPAYYDQAHFNRDFKAFMGMTPLAYFQSPREVLRRAADARRQLLGEAVQGLHPSGG